MDVVFSGTEGSMEWQKKERLALFEMERKLLNDRNGSYREELLKKLMEYERFVKSQIDDGLDPNRFNIFSKLKLAIASAMDTVTNFKEN